MPRPSNEQLCKYLTAHFQANPFLVDTISCLNLSFVLKLEDIVSHIKHIYYKCVQLNQTVIIKDLFWEINILSTNSFRLIIFKDCNSHK